MTNMRDIICIIIATIALPACSASEIGVQETDEASATDGVVFDGSTDGGTSDTDGESIECYSLVEDANENFDDFG
jgi:hypothetical protein